MWNVGTEEGRRDEWSRLCKHVPYHYRMNDSGRAHIHYAICKFTDYVWRSLYSERVVAPHRAAAKLATAVADAVRVWQEPWPCAW